MPSCNDQTCFFSIHIKFNFLHWCGSIVSLSWTKQKTNLAENCSRRWEKKKEIVLRQNGGNACHTWRQPDQNETKTKAGHLNRMKIVFFFKTCSAKKECGCSLPMLLHRLSLLFFLLGLTRWNSKATKNLVFCFFASSTKTSLCFGQSQQN